MIEELGIETEPWREHAACLDTHDVDFFALDDENEVRRAKAMCAGCVVADDCLVFAIETRQPDGVWGGLTPPEREALRRRWQRDLGKAS